MEIKTGIHAADKKDPAFGSLLESWYTQKLKPAFTRRVQAVPLKEAERFAERRRIRTLPVREGLLAATAFESSMTLVTRNLKDFKDLPIRTLNPWEFS